MDSEFAKNDEALDLQHIERGKSLISQKPRDVIF